MAGLLLLVKKRPFFLSKIRQILQGDFAFCKAKFRIFALSYNNKRITSSI
jgi:hypothetical protein